MKLAWHLGRTLAELQEGMSADELRDWMALDRIWPLPDPYWIGAMQASTMVNLWSKEKSTPSDFIPARKPAPTPQQIEAKNKAVMMSLMARQNAALQRGHAP